MAKLPAIMLYPGDWLQDEVSGCTLAAQGLWLRMIFVMHTCTPYGHLAQSGKAMNPETAAQRCGCSPAEYLSLLTELDCAGVPSRTTEEIIFSRRMVRDHRKREESRNHGKRGGNPQLWIGRNPWVNPSLKDPDNPSLNMEIEVEVGDFWWGDGAEGGIELPPPLRTPRFRKAYWEFQTHRRKKHQKLTDGSVRKQFGDLAQWGEPAAVESVHASIRNGWTGIFPPKVQAAKPVNVGQSFRERDEARARDAARQGVRIATGGR